MENTMYSKLNLIKVVLWATIVFSALGLIYHTRWFVAYLVSSPQFVVPADQTPVVWFVAQIFSNIIFLYVGYLLIRLFKKYRQTGFFDKESLKVFNGVIISCLGLAALGALQVFANNFSEVHIGEWKTIESSSNLFFRSFTKLLVFESPQTMYMLLAIILWSVKQFVTRALFIKTENESFI
jgi:hypothetical protein